MEEEENEDADIAEADVDQVAICSDEIQRLGQATSKWMYISSLNIRGWSEDKEPEVRELAGLDSVIVLTEVWRSSDGFGDGDFRMLRHLRPAGAVRRKRSDGVTFLVPSLHSAVEIMW